MLTSPAVAVVIGALAVAGGLLAARWAPRRWARRRWGRVRTAATAVATALVVLLGATYAWAHAMLDRSAAARAMVWFEADVDDLHRFPAREVRAGAAELELGSAALPAGVLDEVSVEGRTVGLADLVEDSRTEALLVLHGRDLVYEQYANGGAPTQLHTSFSVAKSFLSTLLGIALERGEVAGLDDPVTDYVPELLDRDPRFERVTLRHLASMSSGICYTEHSTPWSDDSVTYYAPDLRGAALSVEICGAPGETWHYNNYNPLLMGLVLERATGVPLAEYMSRYLWVPLGAEADASWSLDSTWSGFEKMESGVNALPRDFARFGYLFAHDGVVDGRRVVSRQWVREATAQDATRDPAEHYQLWWWVETDRPGRFSARGNKGQFVYVDRGSDVVVVRLGRDDGGVPWPQVLADITDRVNATGP